MAVSFGNSPRRASISGLYGSSFEGIGRLGPYTTRSSSRSLAAFSDLISTGSLRVIRNPELRDAIVQFYALADVLYEVLRKNSAVYVDSLAVDALFGQGLIRGSFPDISTSFE